MNDCDTTEDAFLGGQLRLRQPGSGHRAGHDAALLAAATLARKGDRAVEFGAGVGAAGLSLARRVGSLELILVEIDPYLAQLARENAALNAMSAQVVVLDVTAPASAFAAAGLKPDSFDVVLMNPPFNDAGRHRASPDPARASAHVSAEAALQRWVQALASFEDGFGSLAILPVHADAAKPANRVLIRAVKGGKAPTQVIRGLVLNDRSGVPNKQAAEILAGREVLPLARS